MNSIEKMKNVVIFHKVDHKRKKSKGKKIEGGKDNNKKTKDHS